jgi:hypothetical protein
MSFVEIDLYVCGAETDRSSTTMRNLAAECTRRYGDAYAINVIDVLHSPGVADRANIVATPTTVIRRPLPAHRLVGDLSQPESFGGWPR